MIMDDDVYDAYREAGALAQRVLHRGAGLVKEEASLLDMVEATEAMVTEEGALLAFPLNVSFNEAAAHDTAMPGDERVFARGDLIKVDLGIHVDGYIADTAMTVDLGDHGPLVEASRAALEAALGVVRPGVTAGELGTAISRSQTSPDTASTATTSTGSPPSQTSPLPAGPFSKKEWSLQSSLSPRRGRARSARRRAWRSTGRSQHGPPACPRQRGSSIRRGRGGASRSPAAGSPATRSRSGFPP